MQRFILTRLFHGMLVLLLVATITFFMMQAAPGGPMVLYDPYMSPEESELLRTRLGLDQPMHVQYVRWLASAARFDFGDSFSLARPVATLIGDRLPATVLLSVSSLVLAIAVSLFLGTLAATFRGSWVDYAATLFAVVGVSVPSFWLGIILILVFSVVLGVLPSSGMMTVGAEPSLPDLLSHLAMPTLVLGLITMAQLTRYTRSSLLGVLGQDYVRTAYAKGLRRAQVLTRHALRNALVPVVTVIGLLLPRLVGGAVVVETVFAWPGIGRLAVTAAFQRDYPVIMGVVVMVTLVVVLSNLIVDVLYGYIDPRIRVE